MRLFNALQRFNNPNLRLRLVSSAILAPVVLLGVYIGNVVYDAMVAAALTLGLYEWVRIVSPKAHGQTIGLACSMLVLLMIINSFSTDMVAIWLGIFFTVLLFLIALRNHEENTHWIAFGIPYLGGSGFALMSLRATPDQGMSLIFFLLAIVWGTDVGAYVAGRVIGGPKLAPSISPSKTWAGLVGGVLLALLLGSVAALVFQATSPLIAAILAAFIAGVSQMGDLFESYFKRRSGVKESGDLIPGHGGILDRIDGLVFAAVFMFLFQIALGDRIHWWG